jgi:hippurate hydrolase
MAIKALGDITERMRQWRHTLHQHPETAYTEFETASLVADVLTASGIEVHTKLAETGVVGVLRRGSSTRSIALRADMDALHIQEENDLPYKSKVAGKMHACGHDGHTAMLLGAAEYLAQSGNFDGTVYFIFQPAEENEGGAARMLEEGLFQRFPADAVYGMHNMPMLPAGEFAICAGPMMAAFATFECTVFGEATHSSMPETGNSPIDPAMAIATAWREFYQQENDAADPFVLATTQIHAGDTWNVIPASAQLRGSTRCFNEQRAIEIEQKMRSIAEKICDEAGVRCEFSYQNLYPALHNSEQETERAVKAASALVGDAKVMADLPPLLGSEDFAYMLQQKQGAYILIGNDGHEHSGCMVHNPNYDFNDGILALGANYWVALVEQELNALLPQ